MKTARAMTPGAGRVGTVRLRLNFWSGPGHSKLRLKRAHPFARHKPPLSPFPTLPAAGVSTVSAARCKVQEVQLNQDVHARLHSPPWMLHWRRSET